MIAPCCHIAKAMALYNRTTCSAVKSDDFVAVTERAGFGTYPAGRGIISPLILWRDSDLL
jgi:hypothetical protein